MDNPSRQEPRPGDFIGVEEFVAAYDQYHDERTTSVFDTLDRAVGMSGDCVRAVNLQARRIRAVEPEDDEWYFRVRTDYIFLVDSLWRLRTIVEAALPLDDTLSAAVSAFDVAVPDLARMRHVAQHLNNYMIDAPGKQRRQRRPDGELVGRRMLEAGQWSTDTFIEQCLRPVDELEGSYPPDHLQALKQGRRANAGREGTTCAHRSSWSCRLG